MAAYRALRILWSPREAAVDAARAPAWVPLLALAVAGGVAAYPKLIELGPAGLVQTRLDLTPNGMFPSGVFFFLLLTYASPLVLPAMAWILAQVGYIWMWLGLDLKVWPSKVLRVTAYGMLPLAIERLLTGVVVILCGNACNPFNPVAANLAFFLNGRNTEVFWYEFASTADLFSMWAVILVSRGQAGLGHTAERLLLIPLGLVWVVAHLLRAWLLG